MNIYLAQMEVFPGQPERNLESMRRHYQQALDQGADLAVFPELCISGYLIGDLWEELSFVRECMEIGQEFASETKATVAVFGNVILAEGLRGEDGRPRKYNASCVAQYGRLLPFNGLGLPYMPKVLHPNYREFDDNRHFYSLRQLALEMGEPLANLIEPLELDLPHSGLAQIGVLLCEDGWDSDYGFSPTAVLKAKGAQLLCNLSASPYTKGKGSKRERLFCQHASTGIDIVYVNQVGVQNNGKTFFAFDGNSALYRADGSVYHLDARFEEKGEVVRLLQRTPLDQKESSLGDEMGNIAKALRLCLMRYLEMAGIRKVVIGASGGIDSAVAASLYVSVLGPDGVTLINMPSRFNSNMTISAAQMLAANLGCAYASVSIEDSVALTRSQIHGLELQVVQRTLSLSDFAMENIQARDRSSRILAAVAAAEGAVFTCNANKAEMTVGYSTLYGDHGGFLAALGDLWKHEVYALGQYLDENFYKKQVIPQEIYDIIPSAELSDKQDVTRGLGDPLIYWYHDRLFRSWTENWNRSSPADLLSHWASGTLDDFLQLPQSAKTLFENDKAFVDDLERWWKLFRGMGVVKRIQSPPVIAVSRRSFGFDYRESILKPELGRRYLTLKQQILQDVI